VLRPVKDIFNIEDYPNLLSGLREPDDAAVWKLDEDRALVVTTDFFTPVVDDPYLYGAIAAANSLSDIYAMGGQPFLALNIAALPPNLPPEVNGEILRGGAETARQAGVVIAGGHTVQDKEPKYGLVVLGFCHPQHMLTKGGAQPGDMLVLSKPLGFGVLTTAIKTGKAAKAEITEVTNWMLRLNKAASELALAHGVRAATDITGFSFLGHSWEMAAASQTGLCFHLAQIPLVSGAQRLAQEWVFPGGAFNNEQYYGKHVRFDESIGEETRMLLFDPQTSGGLLMAVPPQNLDAMLHQANQMQQPLWVVGEVCEGEGITVLP
jgi:selenide,water dikinase